MRLLLALNAVDVAGEELHHMGREVPARGRVLMPMAPQDTQLAWVVGPGQSLQKMQRQMVIIIFLGLDCDELWSSRV